jgi:hypothetical protein
VIAWEFWISPSAFCRRRLGALGAALILAPGLASCADDTQGGSAQAKSAGFGQPLAIPLAQPRFLAIVGGDYKSTALSLLDLGPNQPGDLLSSPPRWSALLHSGSQIGATAMALSGDVVLGHGDALERQLLLVDRGTGVITQVDGVSGAVIRQIPVASGFFANPQDALAIAADRWIVPRMGRNPKPSADPGDFDSGDDLLALNPQTGKVLQSLALGDRSTLAGGVAAPQRLAVLGPHIWVALGSFAADFKAQGPARLLEVQAQSLEVQRQIDLPGQKNCITPRALTDGRLVLACQGSYASPSAQVAESALVVIDPQSGSIVQQLPARPEDGPWSRDVVAVDARWIAAVTLGDFALQRPDRLWLADLSTGARVAISTAAEPFGYSGLWADASRRQIWLGEPKAGADLLRFGVDPAGVVLIGARLASNPGSLGALELGGL